MKRPSEITDYLATPDMQKRNPHLSPQFNKTGLGVTKANEIPRDGSDPVPDTGPVPVAAKSPRIDKFKGPNKTELRFYRDWIITHYASEKTTIRFQPRRYYLSNGHSYRPDWEVWIPQPGMSIIGSLVAFEVKGPYIHSRDSRILFDTAKHDYPEIEWHWAQWRNGKWSVE